MIKKCKFCKCKVSFKNQGFLSCLNDDEKKRLKELKLEKTEHICIDCKKELLFANLVSIC